MHWLCYGTLVQHEAEWCCKNVVFSTHTHKQLVHSRKHQTQWSQRNSAQTDGNGMLRDSRSSGGSVWSGCFPVSILNVWEMEKKVVKSKSSRDNLTLFKLQLVQTGRFYSDFTNLKLRSREMTFLRFQAPFTPKPHAKKKQRYIFVC